MELHCPECEVTHPATDCDKLPTVHDWKTWAEERYPVGVEQPEDVYLRSLENWLEYGPSTSGGWKPGWVHAGSPKDRFFTWWFNEKASESSA